MLDRNAMAQLKGLREELEAQNERVDATVKGTQHRYGFAVTADVFGEELLPAECSGLVFCFPTGVAVDCSGVVSGEDVIGASFGALSF